MSQRIHVVSLIGDMFFGGGENRLLNFARFIDSERFRHSVITINTADPNTEETVAIRNHFADYGITVRDLGEGTSLTNVKGVGQKAGGLMRRARKLSRILKEERADVVDAHMFAAGLTAVAARQLSGVPVAVTLYHPNPVTYRPFWPIARQCILSKAGMIITDSDARARDIRNASFWGTPDIAIIPNGVRLPESRLSHEELRSSFGLSADLSAPVIGQVSSFAEYKGHLVLVEAAREVLRHTPEAFFLLAGYSKDGPDHMARIRERISALGIAHRVRIVSYPGSIVDIWKAIDVHVHASLFDSLPNAIIEGMSLAKPAVVTAVGGIPEAVRDGVSGLVVPPGDPKALAGAIVKVVRNPPYAKRLGEAAFQRYCENYQPERMSRRIETCLAGLVRSSSGRTEALCVD